MEHWFDRLSRPHSRRTMLKAGALAGATLILPAGRIPSAWATAGDPCFKPCTDAAGKDFSSTKNGICKAAAGPVLYSFVVGFGSPLSVVLTYRGLNDFLGCLGNAELDFHRAVAGCRGSECGDPVKYPGGQAPRKPPPKCTPGSEILCGDMCCDIIAQCCPCNSVEGGYICCASNANCDCCPKH
jgi:hypothetical protein